jgi:hypothetical protein
MARRPLHLQRARDRDRGADFVDDRLGEGLDVLVERVGETVDHRGSFGGRRVDPWSSLERCARGRYGCVDLLGRGRSDRGDELLSRGIFDFQGSAAAFDQSAADQQRQIAPDRHTSMLTMIMDSEKRQAHVRPEPATGRTR